MSQFLPPQLQVTKCYHFTSQGTGKRARPHKIMLRHNQLLGHRYVLLDGIEVSGSRGSTTIMSAVEISFKVEDDEAVVTINPDLKGGGFAYSCRLGSRNLPELGSVLETEDELQIRPVKVLVPETRMHSSEKKQVVYYKILVTLSSSSLPAIDPPEMVSVYRRYQEFEKLNRLLRSAFAGSHLLSSLPQLPGKVFNFLTDQTEPSFIECRRVDLETYLKRLILMPKVFKNPDFLRFLTLDPITGSSLDSQQIERNIELRF